jgi:hypothetical protein
MSSKASANFIWFIYFGAYTHLIWKIAQSLQNSNAGYQIAMLKPLEALNLCATSGPSVRAIVTTLYGEGSGLPDSETLFGRVSGHVLYQCLRGSCPHAEWLLAADEEPGNRIVMPTLKSSPVITCINVFRLDAESVKAFLDGKVRA